MLAGGKLLERAVPMVRFDGVTKVYGDRDGASSAVTALAEVSFAIESGQFAAIIGPSGCGKTTLLEMLAGLVRPTNGHVYLGEEILDRPHPDVGIVFQEDATFPWLTNRRNVEFGLEFSGVHRSEWRDRAMNALQMVGLAGFEDHMPRELSGGMRQRLNLARVLAAVPKVVLLDEPFGALDEQTRLRLGDEMLRIWGETAVTFLLVTHSLTEAAVLADVIIAMTPRPGRVAEIVENPLTDRSSEIIGSSSFSQLTGHLWSLLRSDDASESAVLPA